MNRVATSRMTWRGVKDAPPLHLSCLLVALSLLMSPGAVRSSDFLYAGLIGQSHSENSAAASQFAKARQAYEARDFGQAKSLLKQVLQADPKLAVAYLLLGRAEVKSGEISEAIQHYQQALKLQPKSFQGHYYLALAYLRQKNLELGRRELQEAVALNPKHSDAVYNLGVVLLDLGQPQDALANLRRARELGPPRPDIAYNLIRADLALQHPEEARLEAAAAAKSLAADPAWHAAVGRLFLENGQPGDAVLYLAEALRAQPSLAEVRHQLALAQLQSRDPSGALETISNPSAAEDFYLRASAFYAMHRPVEADEACRLALEKAPREARYTLLRAQIRQLVGAHDAALNLLRQAAQFAPEWAEPYYSEGVSYYLMRRYAEARQSLQRALECDPHSARSFFLYAATLVNEGKNREGEKYLHQALALEPRNARFEYHLGVLLLRDNRLGEAQEAFKKALELNPAYGAARYQLGKLMVRQNQPAAAVQELEAAIRDQPDLAQAYYQLSRAYDLLGESAQAQRALAAFNNLKKQATTEDEDFVDEIRKQLESSLR
jgi:tetratricopeptide (TPR) repeat protein